jgi:hypothetical protein
MAPDINDFDVRDRSRTSVGDLHMDSRAARPRCRRDHQGCPSLGCFGVTRGCLTVGCERSPVLGPPRCNGDGHSAGPAEGTDRTPQLTHVSPPPTVLTRGSIECFAYSSTGAMPVGQDVPQLVPNGSLSLTPVPGESVGPCDPIGHTGGETRQPVRCVALSLCILSPTGGAGPGPPPARQAYGRTRARGRDGRGTAPMAPSGVCGWSASCT